MHHGNLKTGARTLTFELSFHVGGLPLARTLCDALVLPHHPSSSSPQQPKGGSGLQISSQPCEKPLSGQVYHGNLSWKVKWRR